jgi:cytochrome c556
MQFLLHPAIAQSISDILKRNEHFPFSGFLAFPFPTKEEHMKKVIIALLSLILCIGFAAAAFSQMKPEVLVKQRQAAMTLQGKYFGPLAAMAQGKTPFNAEVVARNAGYLEVLTKMPWDGFQESTATVKSRALPAVFSESAKFKKDAEEMQAAVGKLVSVSKSKDEAAVKAAIGALGKACGACHDHFREKE